MKKLLIFALFLMIGKTFAQNPAATIEALERKRFAAQVSKEYDFLEKIFADDLVYTHSSGKQDNKVSYIASIKEGKSVYNKIDVEEIKIRVYGNAAVINGQVMIEQNSTDGKVSNLHLKYTAVYSKNGKKGWQINTWQSLKLAN